MSEPQPQAPPRRRLRGLFRFSLRALLVIMTIACIWIGMIAHRAQQQRRAVEAITRDGGWLLYDYQVWPEGQGPTLVPGRSYGDSLGGRPQRLRLEAEPPGPKWLRLWIGDHYFVTPITLKNRGSGKSSENSLRFLNGLPSLETLSWPEATFEKGDFKRLGDLPKLKQLFVHYSNINDEGLAELKRCSELELFGAAGTQISDAGLAHLRHLRKLVYAGLSKTRITDAGLVHLTGMTNLRRVELGGTGVTKEGAAALQRSLPNCEIMYWQ